MKKISDSLLFENFSNIKIPILGQRLDEIENIAFDEDNNEIIKNFIEALTEQEIIIDDYPQIKKIQECINSKKFEKVNQVLTSKQFNKVQDKKNTINFKDIKNVLAELAKLDEEIQGTDRSNAKLPYNSKLMIQNTIIELKTRFLISIWSRLIRRSLQFLRNPPNKEIIPYVTELGVRRTFDYFNQYKHFENLSLGSDDYQREHIMHVFRVYLLGLYLLKIEEKNPIIEEKEPPNFNQIQLEGESEFFKDDQKLFIGKAKFAIWTIIALTHDLGYPLEKLKNINENVTKMAEYFEISELQPLRYEITEKWHSLMDILLNFISFDLIHDKDTKEFKTLLNHEIHSIFSKSFIRYNHGLISSLILYQNLPFFQESLSLNETKNGKKENIGNEPIKHVEGNNLYELSIRREILRSIASHSCEEYSIENLKSFESLLVICDELQEWNRPYAKDRYFRRDNVDVLFEYDSSKIKIWYSMKYEDTDFSNCSKFKINTFLNRFRRLSQKDSSKISIEMVIWKKISNEEGTQQEEKCKKFFEKISEKLEKALIEEMIRIIKQEDTVEFDRKDKTTLGFLLLIGKKPFKDIKSIIINIKHESTSEILKDEEDTIKRVEMQEEAEKKIERLIGQPMIFLIKKNFELKKIEISALNDYD